MWLPTPIYERIPQFWLLLGLLFFAAGLFLGFDYSIIFGYFVVGVACVARSVWIFVARHRHRSAKAEVPVPEEPAETEEHTETDHSDHAPGIVG